MLGSPVEPYGFDGSAVRLLSVSFCASCPSPLESPCADCSSLEPFCTDELSADELSAGVGVPCGQFSPAPSPQDSLCASLPGDAPDEAAGSCASAPSGAPRAAATRVASSVFVRIRCLLQYGLLVGDCWRLWPGYWFCAYGSFRLDDAPYCRLLAWRSLSSSRCPSRPRCLPWS